MPSRITAALAFLITLIAGTARGDEPVTLRFAVPGSGTASPTWSQMWQPWISRVEADAEGTLKLQPFMGATLANMFNVYDRTVSGAADIGTGVQGSIGGKFPGSSVVELPSDIVGEEGAAAFWKLYQDGLIKEEYAAVRPLALFVYPQSFLNAQKPVTTLDEVKGLRLATLTKADAGVAQKLGAAPFSTSPTEVYEILQRHAADGVIIGWLGLIGFKLAEVTSHHLVAGLGSGGGFLLMNNDAYQKLPAKARQALDKNSGYGTSRLLGAALDRIYAGSANAVRAMPGHSINSLAAADRDHFQKEIVQPVVDEWLAKIPNGAAILAAYRREVSAVRSGK